MKLTVNDLNDVSRNTYRFYVSNTIGITESERTIQATETDSKSFLFDKKWDHIFLFGKEVSDFHSLDKEKVFAVAFSALQEVDKIQQSEKAKVGALETEVVTLKTEIETLKAQVATILASQN